MPLNIEPVGALDAQGRRSFIRFRLSDYVFRNYSGRQIQSALRDVGYGISGSDFYAIRADRVDAIIRHDLIRELPRNAIVPMAYMDQNHKATLTQTLQYRFEVSVINPETGQLEIQNRSLANNKQMGVGDALDMAEMIFALIGSGVDGEVVDIELVDVWKKPGVTPEF